jgi:hypothetical protein
VFDYAIRVRIAVGAPLLRHWRNIRPRVVLFSVYSIYILCVCIFSQGCNILICVCGALVFE